MTRPSSGEEAEAVQRQFAEHARSASFHLALSEAMINELLLVDRHGDSSRGLHVPRAVKRCLTDRGLIQRSGVPAYENQYLLSPAGEQVVVLLKMAGFKLTP